MRNFILALILLLPMLSCQYFSKDTASQRVTIKHISDDEFAMVCDKDNGALLHLTDSLLFVSKIEHEAAKEIRDSIASYYSGERLMSMYCLIDEVVFPMAVLNQSNEAQDIDSLKIIISRDLRNMRFNSYGIVSKIHALPKVSLDNEDWWEIENQLVKVKEDTTTKRLFLVTKGGTEIIFRGIVPFRNYCTEIRYKAALIGYNKHKRADSIAVWSAETAYDKDLSHVCRSANSLEDAKSLYQ